MSESLNDEQITHGGEATKIKNQPTIVCQANETKLSNTKNIND